MGALVLQLIHKFCTNYCEAIDGTSAQVQDAARHSGELLGGAKINHIFREQVRPHAPLPWLLLAVPPPVLAARVLGAGCTLAGCTRAWHGNMRFGIREMMSEFPTA